MSVNSSSFPNVTLVTPSLHSSMFSIYVECLKFMASNVIYGIYNFINVLLLLPLYILTLYIAFQRWRSRRSAPAGQSMSHSDIFTYHVITMEILGAFGSLVYGFSIYTNSVTVVMLGIYVSNIIFPGQTLFHSLTCTERYLAVVHPITYMHLREEGRVRIRNISIVCVWLLCFWWLGLVKLYFPAFPFIPLFCMLGVSILVIFFCSLSVLRVLNQPGPGQVGGNNERVDQSKQRAFHVICAIMGVLLLRFVGLVVSFSLSYYESIGLDELCALMNSGICFTVPSSLVLPLLFLHKIGKLAWCRRNTESG